VEEVGVILVKAFLVGEDGPGVRRVGEKEMPGREPDGVTRRRKRLVKEEKRVLTELDGWNRLFHS
jgi:hypothetical protein